LDIKGMPNVSVGINQVKGQGTGIGINLSLTP
jgi:hypothetical protein